MNIEEWLFRQVLGTENGRLAYAVKKKGKKVWENFLAAVKMLALQALADELPEKEEED